jgi:DNA invertase Pin-like site-specific DNA recombinase
MASQHLTAAFELHPSRRKAAAGGEARGQHMVRPPKLAPQQQREARRRRAEGATLRELAKSYNLGKSTISRLADEP